MKTPNTETVEIKGVIYNVLHRVTGDGYSTLSVQRPRGNRVFVAMQFDNGHIALCGAM